ncbi:DUF72 domain-containing protein [Micromonospora sp. NPDC048842]|uniref:DUF72 domain-containing protein n=1 Tax=unclassified Micromonospora TaxID=2617518 RepID=UPI00340E66BA
MARFLGRATALGDRLGPVLLQLPPNLRADVEALDATLRLFPAQVRVAVEPRHPSWWTDATRAVLERRRAALRSWVGRLTDAFGADEPAYVYFNNDPGGAAIVDAVAFAALARQAGHPVPRVPAAADDD